MAEPVRKQSSPSARLEPAYKPHVPPRRASDPSLRGWLGRRRRPVYAATVPATGRVTSVDALRGFSMIWILGADSLATSLREILADKGPLLSKAGDVLGTQFEHVEWEGFRFYDLIFPLFVFVTGVAIVFSLTRLVEQEGSAAAYMRVLRRSVLLFVLGIVCYGGISEGWSEVRLGGVLQRIGICYLFASLLFLNLRLSGLIVAFVALMVGYWMLMTWIPVPGMGAASYAKEANLANWIDAQFLPGRKWDGSWDPEGILSTLPAIGTCLLGVFAGFLLTDRRLTPSEKSLWLVVGGAAMVLAGFAWGLQFPVIKSIWTSSFVLVAGGFSAILLGAFHQMIDVWGRKEWATIFVWIGASAIVLYVANMLVGFEPIATRLVGGDFSQLLDRYVSHGAGRFLSHAVGVTLAIALAGFLYRRKIFLRV